MCLRRVLQFDKVFSSRLGKSSNRYSEYVQQVYSTFFFMRKNGAGRGTLGWGQSTFQQKTKAYVLLASLLISRCDVGFLWSHGAEQALAPSSPMRLNLKSMFATELLTFNASANAWSDQGHQTIPSSDWWVSETLTKQRSQRVDFSFSMRNKDLRNKQLRKAGPAKTPHRNTSSVQLFDEES